MSKTCKCSDNQMIDGNNVGAKKAVSEYIFASLLEELKLPGFSPLFQLLGNLVKFETLLM